MSRIFSKSFWVRSKARPPSRTVRLNNVGDLHSDASTLSSTQIENFPSNEIITSKYTAWSFIFKNLFEQFMRIANFYFLVIAIISVLNPDNPVSPMTSILPLIFVLAVTAVKQGYEDWLRHKEDAKLNNKTYQVVRFPNEGSRKKSRAQQDVPNTAGYGEAQLVRIQSKDIRVGDIVAIEQNEAFPCDLVLLSSSNIETGDCYVTTAGLDGETNLKTFGSVADTKSFITAQQLANIRGFIECEQPVEDLYSFKGKIVLNPTESNGTGSRNPAPTSQAMTLSGSISYGSSTLNRRANNNLITKPLSAYNVLLRGARLKNTEFIFGCAVYTGAETKLSLNSKSSRVKFSRVERMLNVYLLNIILFMLIIVTGSFVGAIVIDSSSSSRNHWYMAGIIPEITVLNVVVEWVSFLVLYNYLIPISLYVTIELQKFFGSLFFSWDVDMYDADIGERAKANTSDLNEELGQIEYLFSDKTGTLTENLMQFRQCSVSGVKMRQVDNSLTRVRDNEPVVIGKGTESELSRFLIAMALCHTARVEQAGPSVAPPGATNFAFINDRGVADRNSAASTLDRNDPGSLRLASVARRGSALSRVSSIAPGDSLAMRRKSRLAGGLKYSMDGSGYEYQSSSPDEKAFLEAACQLGFVFHGTQNGISHVTVQRQSFRFRVLHVLEFDSTRKCMSIMLQDLNGAGPNGYLFGAEYFSLTKGAETAMIQRVSSSAPRTAQDMIMQHVADFASEGLRTLVFGYRPLTHAEFGQLDAAMKAAALRLTDREEALQQAYLEIERNVNLLGASGVEDRLQPDVAETIIALRKAGISVWVLTGDKEETAVNIAYSCGLFDNAATRELRITRQNNIDECRATVRSLLERFRAEPSASTRVANNRRADQFYYGLIVDGASLGHLLSDENLRQALLRLCLRSAAVLCCRVTPLQKAQVVKLIKDGVPGAVTAAIGDGANDVSMIQEAHVGIGIFGKEGRQAARCSDYCFSRFRSLQRCLLLHGHWYYYRVVMLIQYFFYKNIVFMLPQFFFIFFSFYGATSVYDTLCLGMFNVTMTTLPIIVIGLFERHLPERLLISRPELYKQISRNVQMRFTSFSKWVVLAVYHGAALFFLSYMMFGPGPSSDVGKSAKLTNNNYTFGFADSLGSGSVSTLPDGLPMDTSTFGTFITTCVAFVVNGQLALRVRTWTWPVATAFAITMVFYFIFYIIYEVPFLKFAISTYFILPQLLKYPLIWLYLALILAACWLPDMLMRAAGDSFTEEARIRAEFRLMSSAQRDKFSISVTNRSGSLQPASAMSTKSQSAQELFETYDHPSTPL